MTTCSISANGGARLDGTGAVDAEPALVPRGCETGQQGELALLGVKRPVGVGSHPKAPEGRRDLGCRLTQPVD